MKIAERICQLLTVHKVSLRLEGEGIAVPIVDPTEETIRRELARLRNAGPSHVALLATDGGYLQAAGNTKRMTVEGHFVRAGVITHIVLGRQEPPGSVTTIVSLAGPISVNASEVWTAPDVSAVFVAFATTGSISPDLNWRDITTELDIPS